MQNRAVQKNPFQIYNAFKWSKQTSRNEFPTCRNWLSSFMKHIPEYKK